VPLVTYRQEIVKRTSDTIEDALLSRPSETPAKAQPKQSMTTSARSTSASSRAPITTAQLAATAVSASTPAESPQTLGADYDMNRWMKDYRTGGGLTHEALERIFQNCSQRGILVVLVGVPVSSDHRRYYTPEIDRIYRGYLEELAQAHGAIFVDYRDQIPDAQFSDHHHLKQTGGDIFADRLAREVLTPCWKDVGNHGLAQGR
jgi:hypothetical protein